MPASRNKGKNTGTNRRGRPRRNHLVNSRHANNKEQPLASNLLDDIDINQPLAIIRPQALHDPDFNTVSVNAMAVDQRDTSPNSDLASLSSSSPALEASATLTSIGSSELSSEEEEAVLNSQEAAIPHISSATKLAASNTSQGVDLDRLPKAQFRRGSATESNDAKDDSDSEDDNNRDEEEEEERMYQQQQKMQEEQLLAQHYQLQYGSPLMSSKEVLKYSRIYKRPENHYIHYIEPSDIELYDSVEYDMDEQDQCWLDLYNKERRKEFLGDISPYLFECIMDKLEKEWFNLIKDAPKPETEEKLLPEDSACAVCDDTEVENSNAIVFCDGCNVAVHQDCYGIPYIPEGQWLCRKCMISPEFPVSCIFCPNEGGAFKQTNTNQWGHLLCAIWIPEVGVSNAIYMEPIDMIENIPKSRWKLICSICRKKQGACIQCDNKHCFSAFHVTCAKAAKLCMKMNSYSSHSDGVILKAYCEKHTPREYAASHPLHNAASSIDNNESATDEEELSTAEPLTASSRAVAQTSVARGGRRSRGRPSNASRAILTDLQKQHLDETNNKVARAHQHHYSTGAPIAPDIILAKIDNLPCVRLSGVRKRPQLVTTIAHYWSLKRESRRGAPLLKRLHLEPWTAYSKYNGGENDHLIRKGLIVQLRTDLEKVRILSEQVQKREKLKLERTRKQKAYLEMIFFPLEHIIRPVLNQFAEIDRKKLLFNHVAIEEAPDYLSIVEQPMCFSEIYQKLADHSYTSFDQFKNDMQLIWQNSLDYNTSDTGHYKVANKLKTASHKLFAAAEDKLSRMQFAENGMLEEPIDTSIFNYDLSFEEEIEEEQTPPPQVPVDKEAQEKLKLEREQLKAEKEKDHRRAIQARVEGKARAKALREENKRKGIIAPTVTDNKPARTISRVLRTRSGNLMESPSGQGSTTVTAATTGAGVATEAGVMNLVNMEVDPLAAKEQTLIMPHSPRDEMATEVLSLEVQQPPYILPHNDIAMPDVLNSPEVKRAAVSEEIQVNSPTATISGSASPAVEDKKSKKRRRHESPQVTPRLTRSNGLKASIEEIIKRPKISHEARALFASYNGVSHLNRPVEVYKENRKIHAPIGWVYLDDDDDDDDENDHDDEDSNNGNGNSTSGENSSNNSVQDHPERKKNARHGRNDIAVPGFNRGEIVWARVNGYPSHPAKFLNYSDEEAGPKLVASRRYNGDVLVEFLKVPEMHRFGWVGRRTICEIGDHETDRKRLSETLQKKIKKREFIEEAKDGYRCAGEILGLDPEPLLSEVFDHPPEPKRKRKHSHSKKRK